MIPCRYEIVWHWPSWPGHVVLVRAIVDPPDGLFKSHTWHDSSPHDADVWFGNSTGRWLIHGPVTEFETLKTYHDHSLRALRGIRNAKWIPGTFAAKAGSSLRLSRGITNKKIRLTPRVNMVDLSDPSNATVNAFVDASEGLLCVKVAGLVQERYKYGEMEERIGDYFYTRGCDISEAVLCDVEGRHCDGSAV